MITYEQYFEERFSLNPLNWFKVDQVIDKLSREEEMKVRKSASESFRRLKETLRKGGYTTHRYYKDYTQFSTKTLGLSKLRDEKKPITTLNHNKVYLRVLFTMAHEVGHTLQWSYDDDIADYVQVGFKEFIQEVRDAGGHQSANMSELKHMFRMYLEIDAWVRGMEYIPRNLIVPYKEYARACIATYRDHIPAVYKNTMKLRNLMYKLSPNDRKL